MPDITSATSDVTKYSSVSGNLNASPFLQNASIVKTNFYCSGATTGMHVACETPTTGSCSGSASSCNALTVTQQASVPLWLGGIIGIHSFTMQANASAAMAGGGGGPWNIAIILDATGSMKSTDSGTACTGKVTKEACALQGIQALLENIYPCATGVTCSSSTAIADNVALYVFPPVLKSTAPDDYCYGGASPANITHEYYEVPTLPNTGTASTTWTNTIIPFYSSSTTPTYPDFRTSDSATTLNTSSNFVKATGYTGTSCAGVDPIGGAGTYYPQVIYQAQSDLVTEQGLSSRAGSRNAIVLLGDGDQNASVSTSSSGTYVYSSSTKNGKTTYTYISSTSDLQPSATNSLNGIPANNPTSTTYPSAVGQCGQGVIAAQAATQAGTRVYTIGYGAVTSGGCSTDSSYSASGNSSYGGGKWPNGSSKQPCDELAAMASNIGYFYSDDSAGCAASSPTNSNIKSLSGIFQAIYSNMTVPRLIPNGQ